MTHPDSPERIAERIVGGLRACDPTIVYSGAKIEPIKAAIAQAIADERRRVFERCATIADERDDAGFSIYADGPEIASAIRAAGKE